MTAERASPTIGVVVLAAGGSTRLGRPKQLLPFRGRTLLRHAAETACAAAVGPVVVVLGADTERMRTELDGLEVRLVENARWEEGMSTSLVAGLDALESLGHLDGALVTTCDQPRVTPEILRELIGAFAASRPPLVACEYGGVAGVPALFDRRLFVPLRALVGDTGARSVIARHRATAVVVPFPDAALDVDTEEDVGRLG